MNKPRISVAAIIIFVFIAISAQPQSVSINNNGASADANAILDVDITTNNKGILIPRLSTAQLTAMGVVTTGMLAFNETVGDFQYFDGTQWRTVGFTYISSVIQDPDNDTKVQTNKNADEDKIRFDTEGTERMVLDNTGLGIGTSSPSAKLDVVGSFQLVNGSQGANKYLTSDAAGNTSWTGNITSTGSLTLGIRTITGPTTVLATDNVVVCDAGSGAYTVTLPTAVGAQGRVYSFKKLGSSNNVTIDAAGAELIDGSQTYTLTSAYKSVRIISNGTRWLVLGGF